MPDLKIPRNSENIRPEWLTQALRSTGVIKHASISAVDSTRIGVGRGFIGQIYRLALDYDVCEKDAPRSLIAKLTSADPYVKELMSELGLYEREVRFYDEIADGVELGTPRLYYSDMDVEAGDYVLLIEDLSFARAGDDVKGCSHEDVFLAVRELAKFHAGFWENSRLDDFDWMPSFDGSAELLQASYKEQWERFEQRYGEIMPSLFREAAAQFGGHVACIMTRLGQPPRTIVHGDFRLDNMIFGKSDDDPPFTLLDWQISAIGRGVIDIAYFMSYLDEQFRRAIEQDALRTYHSTLLQNGVAGYSFDQCFEDYRLAMFHPLFVAVVSGVDMDLSNRRAQLLTGRMIRRLTAAMVDHNVLELLP